MEFSKSHSYEWTISSRVLSSTMSLLSNAKDSVTFMGCLINNSKDAGFLFDHKIINNYYGTDEEVTRFFEKFAMMWLSIWGIVICIN
jgi:hypothetical protein